MGIKRARIKFTEDDDFERSRKWAKGFFSNHFPTQFLFCAMALDDMPQGFENEIKTEFHSQL